jgi:hypothetical protein
MGPLLPISSNETLLIANPSPISAYWTLSSTPQSCMNERVQLLITGIIYTLTNVFVISLAFSTTTPRTLNQRQKLLLWALLAAGSVACIAGIAKLGFTWIATSSYDRTWVSYGRWVTSLLELNIGIVGLFHFTLPSIIITLMRRLDMYSPCSLFSSLRFTPLNTFTR